MLQAGNAVDKHHALAKQMLAAGLHEAAAVRNIVEKSLYEEIFLLMQGQHIKDEQHCLLHGGVLLHMGRAESVQHCHRDFWQLLLRPQRHEQICQAARGSRWPHHLALGSLRVALAAQGA